MNKTFTHHNTGGFSTTIMYDLPNGIHLTYVVSFWGDGSYNSCAITKDSEGEIISAIAE